MPVQIHPTAFVEDGAQLGTDVTVGPFCHVGAHAVIGDGCDLHSHSVVIGHTSLGANSVLFPHATLGCSPQVIGFQASPESRLEVGAGCTFREYATVCRNSVV